MDERGLSHLPAPRADDHSQRVPIDGQRVHCLWGVDGQWPVDQLGPLELEQRRRMATIARHLYRARGWTTRGSRWHRLTA